MGKLITQFSFAQIPGYPKLVVLNDAAITPYPTLEQKAEQIMLVSQDAAGYQGMTRKPMWQHCVPQKI